MSAPTRISNRAEGIVAAVSIFLFAFVVIVPGAFGWEPPPTGDYSGRAYGLWVHTPPPTGSDTTFADTGDPNQLIYVPNVFTLVINEQNVWSDPSGYSITVNALHLWAQGVEIVASSAHSDISCPSGPPPPPVHDFVTGGGWIWSNGFHANFGFEAGYKPNQPLRGELNWVDHGTEYHIKATTVDSYGEGTGPGSGPARTFSGEATVNGDSGYHYTITVQDNAEPGHGVDWIDFVVTNDIAFYYHPTGDSGAYLAGGNIQVHTNP